MNDKPDIVATLLKKHRRSITDKFDPLELLKTGEVSLIHPECGGGAVKPIIRWGYVYLKCAFCERRWSFGDAELSIALDRATVGQTTTVSVRDRESGEKVGINFQWEQ